MGEPGALLVETSEGVACLTLNRPRRRNALTIGAVRELIGAVTAALDDADVGALLLCGADHAFCSGIDLHTAETTDDGALDPTWFAEFGDTWADLHRRLAAADKPIVAALECAAVNAGAALALSADLLVAGRTAFLQIAEVERNMPARINLAWLVARYGSARALDLALTARRADGTELYRLGIAHTCVEDDAVGETARALAARLARLPRTGVAQTKRLVRTLERENAPGGSLCRASAAELGGAR